jgi:transcriptional regulator with XRE-family HTH domain
VPTAERGFDRSTRRAARIIDDLAREIHDARLMAGASQESVAKAARVSHSTISRIESARLAELSILEAVVVAAAVGLDLSVRAYPGRNPTRDAAHARKLTSFLAHVAPPLRYSLEVLLPPREAVPEQRAWDAMIYGPDGDTGVELEMRLYDLQAQTRRIMVKWRDSGAPRMLLLINDTRANRRIVRAYPQYLGELPRLQAAAVQKQVARGERPESGYVLI